MRSNFKSICTELYYSIGGETIIKIVSTTIILFALFSFYTANATEETEYEFNIVASDAELAIKEISRLTGNSVIYQSDDVDGIQINPLKGRYTLQKAIDALLEGTTLIGSLTSSGVITISPVKLPEDPNKTKKSIFAAFVELVTGNGEPQNTEQAQFDETQSEPNVLEEIIVTARRRSESLQDVPVAITAFSETKLKSAGIDELGDILNNTVGMVYNERDGNRSQIEPGARGIKPNGVSTFFDAMPVAGSQAVIPFIDVASVEVYRGPQSATFGRSVYAGALNYTLRQPSLVETVGEFNVKFGEDGREEISGYVTTPLIEDKLGLYFSGTKDQYDGPSGLVSTDGFQMGSRDSEYFTGAISYHPKDELSMTLRYTSTSIDDGPAPDYNLDPATDPNIRLSPTPGRAPLYFGELQFIEDPVLRRNFCFREGQPDQDCIRDPGWKLERDRLAFNANYDMKSGASLSFRAFDSEDSTFDHDDQDNTDLEIGFMAVINMGEEIDIKEEYFELLWTSPSENRVRYTLGYSNYSFDENIRAFFIHPSATIDGVGSAPNISMLTIANQGVFGGIFYDVNDKLTVSLEGRYQEDDISALDPDPTDDNVPESISETFLPRIALNYTVNDQINLYAQYSEGVLPASVNPGAVGSQQRAIAAAFEGLVVDGATLSDATPFLDSVIAVDESTLTNYEIGLKGRFLDDRLSLNVSLFSMDTDGFAATNANLFFFPEGSDSVAVLTALEAVGAATGNGLLQNLSDTSVRVMGDVNVGTLKSDGLELDFAYLVNNNWQVDGRFTYLDTRYGNACFPLGADFGLPTQDLVLASGGTINCTDVSGNDYQFTPNSQIGGTITYSNRLSNGWDWFTRLDGRYESRQFLSEYNAGWLPSSTIFALRAGINIGESISIEGYVENLTDDRTPLGAQYEPDRKEVEAFTGNRGPANNTGLNVAAAYPREVGIRFSYKF